MLRVPRGAIRVRRPTSAAAPQRWAATPRFREQIFLSALGARRARLMRREQTIGPQGGCAAERRIRPLALGEQVGGGFFDDGAFEEVGIHATVQTHCVGEREVAEAAGIE